MSVIKKTSCSYKGHTFHVGDCVDIISFGRVDSTFTIKFILLYSNKEENKGHEYFGMINPYTNEYYGNSDCINKYELIKSTSNARALSFMRKRKIDSLNLM